MIDLYTWPTPNGHKIHIMLEETGLEYRVHPIDIGAGDQFKPEFLAISPNKQDPGDGRPAGARRQTLRARGVGRDALLPRVQDRQVPAAGLRKRWQVLQWVMTQMGHVGPMLGQAHTSSATRPRRSSTR